MSRTSNRVWTALLTCALLGSSIASASACTCLNFPTIVEAVSASSVVFRGRVAEIRTGLDPSDFPLVTLEVHAYWKDTTSVFGSSLERYDRPGHICPSGMAAQASLGTEWIVFAESGLNGLETSECLRTFPWSLAPSYGYVEALGDALVVANERENWSTVKAVFGEK